MRIRIGFSVLFLLPRLEGEEHTAAFSSKTGSYSPQTVLLTSAHFQQLATIPSTH